MQRAAAWVLLLLPFGFSACVDDPPARGPLPVRNQHPAQLTVLHLDPVAATALAAGDLTLRQTATYSSLFLGEQSGASSFQMDGETLDARSKISVGLGAGIELATELPLLHNSGGFLDDFLIGWHRTLGLPDQGRSTAPRGAWAVSAVANGQTALQVDTAALALEDIPVQAKWQWLDPASDAVGVALRGGVELPTGEQAHGFGNGGVDYAVGAALERRQWQCIFYGHVSHTFAATPQLAQQAGLSYADVTSAGIGAELPLSPGFELLLQTEWENSTLRHLDVSRASRDQQLLWFGARWSPRPTLHVELAIGEDLIPYASPDFSVYAGFAWTPAARR
jgi:hypothetical protein